MDYKILHLISLIYNVEFSAYSEEPNMDLFMKCRNGSEDTYDYDKVLSLDQETVDRILEKDIECELMYYMPIKEKDPYTKYLINEIKNNNIKYSEEKIDTYEDYNSIYGIYYDNK